MLIFIGSNLFSRGTAETTQSKSATETKTVTDHAGNTVEIPVNPKRIASLSDATITLVLLELNAPIVGTHTRTAGNKKEPFIYGSKELFNISMGDTDYIDYGNSDIDIEKVKASRPDLIIGTTYHTNNYTVLSAIAPTVLTDYGKGRKLPQDVAQWVGKEKKYNELNAQYKKRLSEVKAKFTIPPQNQTLQFIGFPSKDGAFYAFYNSGSIHVVSRDLGFKPTSFEREHYIDSWGDSYSIELINDIYTEADYIVMRYTDAYNENPASVQQTLDKRTPQWKQNMKAYKADNFITFQGEWGSSYTFVAYNYMLDIFEQHAK